ncbi:MAG: hypothetical protein LBJ12_01425 [Oscillospiraceae bacterium]|jgi:hypothetical protein|nr:hypothetical protein [Oscillospiraceae bacterium]
MMEIFTSEFDGQTIDDSIMKSGLLDNVSTHTDTLPSGTLPFVNIIVQPSGYLYEFGIPQGQTGQDGTNLFDKLVEIGYTGTEQQMFSDLLNLL